MAHYAWSEIRHADKEGKVTVVLRGEKVAKTDFKGLTDADWNAMLTSGSIREKPFPAPAGYEGSAIDYLRESLEEAQSSGTIDEEEAVSKLVEVQAEATKLEATSTASSGKK